MQPLVKPSPLPAAGMSALHPEPLAAGSSTGAPRILIVDDHEVNRRILRAILSRGGYELLEAADGPAALAAVAQAPPDLVLLDVMMPGMDGYQVCERLRHDPVLSETPVIFLSALDDSDSKVRGFEAGAVDYVAKPFDNSEVLARVRTHLRLRQLNRELRAVNERLVEKQAALDEDLEAAAGIQRSLLPRRAPDVTGLSFAWRFQPCDQTGGDVFDFLVLDREHLGLYIVDVSGHGVSAAMITVSVAQSLRPESGITLRRGEQGPEIAAPAEVLRQLDRDYPVERFGRHFTIWYGVLNHRDGRLRYSCAGHPPALWFGKGRARGLDAGGTIIGLGGLLPFEEEDVQIQVGDRLYLYSDGILEHGPEGQAPFSESRLRDALFAARAASLEESCAAVLSALDQFAPGVKPLDDISLVAIEREPASTPP